MKIFQKKIDTKYLKKILNSLLIEESYIKNIPRKFIESKSKNLINYIEIDLDTSNEIDYSYDEINISNIEKMQYVPISDFPSSIRDLSFSVMNYSMSEPLQNLLLNFHHELLKEVFIFDYFLNKKNNEIKIGFRFIFQSTESTITDIQVNQVISEIIEKSLELKSVSIPGL